MKKVFTILFFSFISIIFLIPVSAFATPSNLNFVDDEFYKCVVDHYNFKNNAGYSYDVNLTNDELNTIERLSCSSNDYKITNVTGLNKLENVIYVDIGISTIDTIDVSNNKKLTFLAVNGGNINTIDVSNNLELTSLQLHNNKLTTIDVSKNTKLELLNVYGNPITSIDVSNNIYLKELDLISARLATIDVSKNTELTKLRVQGTMNSIDVSNNLKLTWLEVTANLTSIDLSNNQDLKDLDLPMNDLTEIDLSNNVKLKNINLAHNKLTEGSIKLPKSIERLGIFANDIETIDLREFTNLKTLNLWGLSNNKNIAVILNVGVTINSYYKTDLFVDSTDSTVVLVNGNQFTTLKEGTSILNTLCSTTEGKITVIVKGQGAVEDMKPSENEDDVENPNTGSYEHYLLMAIIIASIVGIVSFIKNKKEIKHN